MFPSEIDAVFGLKSLLQPFAEPANILRSLNYTI